jgi:hypothetical protein
MRQELVRQLKQNIIKDEEQAKKNGLPAPLFYAVSINDGPTPCQCDKCQALVKTEESEAGPLLYFVNKVADEVKLFRPSLHIITNAYLHALKPPKTMRANDNVFVRLADTPTNWARPHSAKGNTVFLEYLREWNNHAKNLGVWDYSITFPPLIYLGMPFGQEFIFAEDVKDWADLKVKTVFTEFEYPDITDMHTMGIWLEAKMMEDPKGDFEKYFNVFIEKYYGAAGVYIDKFRRIIRDATQKSPVFLNLSAHPNSFTQFDFSTVKSGCQLFEQAEKAVADDPVLLKRVQRARMSLDRVVCIMPGRIVWSWILNGGKYEDFPIDLNAARKRLQTAGLNVIDEFIHPCSQQDQKTKLSETIKLFEDIGRISFKPSAKFTGQSGVIEYTPDQANLYGNDFRLIQDEQAECGYALKVSLNQDVGKYRVFGSFCG